MSDDFTFQPIKDIPPEQREPTAARFLALGIHTQPDDVTQKLGIAVETLDDATIADTNAMMQLVAYLGGSELPYAKGQLGESLHTYEALSVQLLHSVSDEDEQPWLDRIGRSAVEDYPFFCDGEQLAQHSGLSGWDIMRDQRKDA